MELAENQEILNDIWRLAREGDITAIEYLVDYIITGGRSFLIHFVRRSSLGDKTGYTTHVLQETAIRVWRLATAGKLKSAEEHAYFTLGRFVTNIAREAHRLHKVLATRKPLGRIGLAEVEDALFTEGADPSFVVSQLEEHLFYRNLLQAAMLGLPGKDRALLKARMAGKNEREIAEDLGISHAAARQRYSRAVAALAENFKSVIDQERRRS